MSNQELKEQILNKIDEFRNIFEASDFNAAIEQIKIIDNTILKEITDDIKTNYAEQYDKANHYLDLVSDGPVTKRKLRGNLSEHLFNYRMWLTSNYRAVFKNKIVPQDTARAELIDKKIGDKRLYRQSHKITTKNRKMTEGRSMGMLKQYYSYGSLLGAFAQKRQGMFMFHPEDCVYCGVSTPFEVFLAMGLTPYFLDSVQGSLRAVDQMATTWYLDKLSEMGVTADTCSFARMPSGVALAGHFFKGIPCAVFSNLSCDSSLANYAVCERELGVPTFYIDHPYRFKTEKGIECFVEQLYEMIDFLEKHTGHKMDWDKLKEACEYTNQAQKYELERWELQKACPPPSTADMMIGPHNACVSGAFGGTKEAVEILQNQVAIMRDMVAKGEGAVPDVKYRAVLWNPPPGCYANFQPWIEQCWGVVVLNDMETFGWFGSIDTSSRESMLKGLAEKVLYAPMARHTRGDVNNFFDDLWLMCDMYKPDFIIMCDHIGCHPVNALTGALNEQARERGIKLMRFHQDLADVRVVSHQEIRNQVNTFMSTVMNATPLDSSLLNFDDTNEW